MNIRRFYYALLMVQTVLLTYLFFCGPRGWRDIAIIQQSIDTVQQKVNEKKQLVAQLQEEELSWQRDSFNKERMAREQLQMARATDTVFYR